MRPPNRKRQSTKKVTATSKTNSTKKRKTTSLEDRPVRQEAHGTVPIERNHTRDVSTSTTTGDVYHRNVVQDASQGPHFLASSSISAIPVHIQQNAARDVTEDPHSSTLMSSFRCQIPQAATNVGGRPGAEVLFESSQIPQIEGRPAANVEGRQDAEVSFESSQVSQEAQNNANTVNRNLGMIRHSELSQSNGLGVFDSRLQLSQAPAYMSSVYEPISAHIPVRIKEKIWNSEFIDLGLLLKSARDLVNEPNLDGDVTVRGGFLSVMQRKKTPLTNIHVWTSSFMIFMGVLLEKWPHKGQDFLKYMQTVRLAASRGVPGGWVQYDEQFRLRKARCPSLSWGVVDTELWVLYVSTARNTPQSSSGENSIYSGAQPKGPQRANPSYGCKAFNRGKCSFGKRCRYEHKCSKCAGSHTLQMCNY